MLLHYNRAQVRSEARGAPAEDDSSSARIPHAERVRAKLNARVQLPILAPDSDELRAFTDLAKQQASEQQAATAAAQEKQQLRKAAAKHMVWEDCNLLHADCCVPHNTAVPTKQQLVQYCEEHSIQHAAAAAVPALCSAIIEAAKQAQPQPAHVQLTH